VAIKIHVTVYTVVNSHSTCACSHSHLFAEALQNELSFVKFLPSYNITSRGSINLLDFYFVLSEYKIPVVVIKTNDSNYCADQTAVKSFSTKIVEEILEEI